MSDKLSNSTELIGQIVTLNGNYQVSLVSLIDAVGHASFTPLLLLPAIAIATAAMSVVVLCDDLVHVFSATHSSTGIRKLLRFISPLGCCHSTESDAQKLKVLTFPQSMSGRNTTH